MFINNYLEKLRNSDEKTKHRSALTMSIIISIIILIILFLFFKDAYFNFNNKITDNTDKTNQENENLDIESPLQSFKVFFKESGNQFTNIKSSFIEMFNNSSSTTK